MSTDYSDLFKAHEEKKRAADQRDRQEKQAVEEWRAAAVAHLSETVLPAFREAAAAIQSHGYTASIREPNPAAVRPGITLAFAPNKRGVPDWRGVLHESSLSIEATPSATGVAFSVQLVIMGSTGSRSESSGPGKPLDGASREWAASQLRAFVESVLKAAAPR